MANKFDEQFKELLDRAGTDFTSNGWIEREDGFEGKLDCYFRVGVKGFGDGNVYRCLHIATLSTPDKKERGKGRFGRLLVHLRTLTELPFYVENAHARLAKHCLEKQGFKLIEDTAFGALLYRFD